MKKNPTKQTPEKSGRTADLMTIARMTKEIVGDDASIDLVQRVMQAEQQACAGLLADGAKVVLWNYLTMYPAAIPARKLTSPKNGQTYDVPASLRVAVRVGAGLRRAVNSAPVAQKLPQSQRKGAG